MNFFGIIFLLFFVILYLYPLLAEKKTNYNDTSEKKITATQNSNLNSLHSISQNKRWDYQVLEQDAEKPEIIESLRYFGKKITQDSTPLRWILSESPAAITVFVLYCCSNPEEEANSETYEFWKFMHEPGTEIILTEAAYRGYLPAMSILTSHYENEERSEECEYWQKFGVAHLNPTSILLRGLNLMIQGKLSKNDTLCNQGKSLVILSHMLGEENAKGMPGFESLANTKPYDSFIKEDILKTIYEIENLNEEIILEFLTEVREIMSNDHVKATDCIGLIKKINDILDKSSVTVMEIAILLPLRNTIIDMLNVELNDNNEFIDAFEKAEIEWRYKRIGFGSNFIAETVIPMMFNKQN